MNHLKIKETITLVSDPEGNLNYFNEALEPLPPKILQLLGLNVSSPNVSSSKESYVSLGDIGDKNNGDLQIYHDIKRRIQHLSQKWTLIAGNRDDNKIRFLSEFTNKEYINTFLTKNDVPYWPGPSEKPIDYCLKK